MKIKITKNGPYIVTGNVPIYKEDMICDEKGASTGFKNKEKIDVEETYTLCRCGQSKNKPFCDGSHVAAGFDGTEVASKNIYKESLTTFETDQLKLEDAIELCDHSRFCQHAEGIRTLMEKGDNESIALAKEEASNCPSGRLLIWDKQTGESTEKSYDKEIVILHDQGKDCEGPIWVKGKIPLESEDGELYEERNRITLCRCGKSRHKPFCDGRHWMSPETEAKFRKKWNLKDIK
ncbi:CDGSH iron-sulfur domain-containing protein [Methanobrevibacter sp. TMH8]|uniref:CDGSH iron-sulfur domain-containing protein n=1 Tax=Methanobrevibacter sp. TMH8 TaxID=2848611 RepID=UPI001CC91BDE|nr:CDGSH iron-sulfur domain-containing protein [Methanobrevibacter sp. TMH8]MBZ9570845.1 CDGSH iron-sulfur domain-containing protein [Methanobrevibacter sp. TMH8]